MSDENATPTYYALGDSSLTVSRLALGAMTFGDTGPIGTENWGANAEESRRIFDAYLDSGGNFLDTASSYTFGESEKMLGSFVKDSGSRDKVVIATKFGHPSAEGANAGGGCRISVIRSVEQSLQRLGTDYIDLCYIHGWDRRVSPDELLSTMNDLVRQGKIRYIGLSNVPSWYASRMQAVAELRGLEKVCALQYEYSLVSRDIESEYVPLATRYGMGITGFAPLAAGFLTGKYKRNSDGKADLEGQGGRLSSMKDIPVANVQKFSERNWLIHDALESVANELGRSMSQVAVRWAMQRPGMGSIVVGASKLSQLEDSLQAQEFELPAELMARLTEASQPNPLDLPYPHSIVGKEGIKFSFHGGLDVEEKPEGYYNL